MGFFVKLLAYFALFFREERKSFIRAKYIDKAFIQPYYSSTRELYSELEQAIDSHNLADLLQCFAEGTHLGVELTDSLPNSVSSWSMATTTLKVC
jgi:hypothetical protein